MGSLVSKRAATAATAATAAAAAAKRSSAPSPPLVKPAPTVTPTVRPSTAPHQRKTPDEWAATLSQITHSITSTSYPNTSPATAVSPGANHPAQRSKLTVAKLPGRGGEPHKRLEDVAGRLSQNQVIALFNMRKKDPHNWGPHRMAERFGVDETQVTNLLRFTRTYTGRLDPDGRVRAYYKADLEDTINAFERD